MKKFDNFDRESNEFKEINLSIKILEVWAQTILLVLIGNYKIQVPTRTNVLTEFSQIWECFNYIDYSNKVDLTNTAATIIGIIIGSIIGAIISW